MKRIPVALGLAFGAAAVVGSALAFQFRRDMAEARCRLADYPVRTIDTSFGPLSYLDEGDGLPVLISHGIFGGYDQGYVSLRSLLGGGYRILSPSRFGYPGSALPAHPSPEHQAAAFRELVTALDLDGVHVLATSAGGAPALRFAIDHPDLVRGLILLSSGVPSAPMTAAEVRRLGPQGPPSAIVHDFPMWLSLRYFSAVFDAMMGAKVDAGSLLETMLPVAPRRSGVLADTRCTNIDMLVRFEDYPVEEIEAPVLVLHAKDDPMAPYENIERLLARIDAETAIFETGGHLLAGHGTEVNAAIEGFLLRTA